MSRTITAMFDTRADAEAGKERLKAANLDANHINIHDQSSAGYNAEQYSTTSTHEEGRGVWSSIKNAFMPDEDRHTYEEGIRRGGFVLTADVDDDQIDHAVAALEDSNSIDIDERAGQWKSQGWDYDATKPAMFGAAATSAPTTPAVDRDRDRAPMMGSNADEQRIPIVEEQLVVGKRDVDRGGVRVRSYVTERPVHEQVSLHNEKINVERRPVDLPLSAADGDAFKDQTIAMTAKGEEAVIGKDARVVEEVLISKTAEDRVQDVNDTVRRTDVEIENDATTDRDRKGMGDTSGGNL